MSPSAAPVHYSASPSQVVPPVTSIPSLASEEGLKSLVQSVLASFLSQPTLSLGSNPFVAAPSAEVPNVSNIGSAGGSKDDNLMRGSSVAPSGMVPPPIQEDSLPPNVNVSVASSYLHSGVGVGVGVRAPLHPSVG